MSHPRVALRHIELGLGLVMFFDIENYVVSEDGHFDSDSHIDESNRRFSTRMDSRGST